MKSLPWLALAAFVLGGCPTPTPPPPPPPDVRPPPPELPPPPPSLPADAVVGAGAFGAHVCVLRQGGAVACWGGKNTYGQLGGGGKDPSAELVTVTGVDAASAVATGRDFSCALREGSVLCWGNDEDGQLGGGKGVAPGALSLTPVTVSGLANVQQLSLGEYFGCALARGGRVSCWGNGADGQLGRSVKRAHGTPLVVDGLGPVAEIAVGRSHACARLENGTVSCWGRNTEGQLGDGISGSRSNHGPVKGLLGVKQLASGHTHSCALSRDGDVSCWGSNKTLELGPSAGSEAKSRVPIAVPGLEGVVQVAAGGRHTCVRTRSKKVFCWGDDAAGQLGAGAPGVARAEPAEAKAGRGAIALALGEDHTCVVRADGTLSCWGGIAKDVGPGAGASK